MEATVSHRAVVSLPTEVGMRTFTPASLTLYTAGRRAGNLGVHFGRDDRDPKFNKLRGVFFTNEAGR